MRDGFGWFAVQALLEQSTCQVGHNDLEAANQSTLAAIELSERFHYGIAGLRAAGFLTSHWVNEGRYREAIQLACDRLEQIKTGGFPRSRAHQFYNDLMRCCERLARWHAASASEAMAVQVASRNGFRTQELLGWCKLADFAQRTGDWETAKRYSAEATALARKLPLDADTAANYALAQIGLYQTRRDLDGIRSLKQYFPALGKNAFFDAPYWNALADLALERGNAVAADDYADRAEKAIDRGTAVSTRGGDRWQFRREAELAATYRTRAKIARGDYATALQAWLEFATGSRTISESHAMLAAPGTLRVVMATLGDRIAVWAKSGDELKFRWSLASAAETNAQIRSLRLLCMNPNAGVAGILSAARQLGDSLFGELIPTSGAVRMDVYASGDLSSFPLPLVLENASRATIARAAFVAFESLRSSSECQSEPDSVTVIRANRIHGKFQDLLPPLPGSEQESRDVAQSFLHSRILAGNETTPAELNRAASRGGVLHFVGHAIRWSDGVALVAAPDPTSASEPTRLGLWRLGPQDAVCSDLVFFSACSTEIAEDTDAVGSGQLAQSMLAAGARRVVATLWDVDSVASGQFVREFYRSLHGGESPSVAMDSAARQLRRQSRYKHPYYWAPFVLFETIPI